MTGRFLRGVPGPQIEAIFDAAAGNEIATGKFDSPESSAALAANAFGFFLQRASDLPALPGCGSETWPALSLMLEAELRFPWSGGRHPVLDCLVRTPSALIGIESKRFEPLPYPTHLAAERCLLAAGLGRTHERVRKGSRQSYKRVGPLRPFGTRRSSSSMPSHSGPRSTERTGMAASRPFSSMSMRSQNAGRRTEGQWMSVQRPGTGRRSTVLR